jgi:hypothetical protein
MKKLTKMHNVIVGDTIMTTEVNPQTEETLSNLLYELEELFDCLSVELYEFPEGFLDMCNDLKIALLKMVKD